MNEVVDKNFKTLYPKIEEAIKKASFISIDAEFTGIQSSEVLKYRLELILNRNLILTLTKYD